MAGEENWHSENINNPFLQQLEAFLEQQGKMKVECFQTFILSAPHIKIREAILH